MMRQLRWLPLGLWPDISMLTEQDPASRAHLRSEGEVQYLRRKTSVKYIGLTSEDLP